VDFGDYHPLESTGRIANYATYLEAETAPPDNITWLMQSVFKMDERITFLLRWPK
jgi:hypothetical protein